MERKASRLAPHAYTLLELVLVLGLLVVVTAVLWPAIASWAEGDRLDRAGDDLVGLLVGLRVRAIEEGQEYVFAFQPGSAGYEIISPAASAAGMSSAAPEPAFDSGGAQSLATGLRFQVTAGDPQGSEPLTAASAESSTQEIHFYPDGTATPAGFEVVDEAGARLALEVRGLTGSARILGPTGAMP